MPAERKTLELKYHVLKLDKLIDLKKIQAEINNLVQAFEENGLNINDGGFTWKDISGILLNAEVD